MNMYIYPDCMEIELGIRLLISCICGFLVGMERTKNQKVAGIRTYIIVAMGATIFTMVSKYGFLDAVGGGVRVDVSRVACNIVTGVSFLGAGTIFVRGNRITGLTTAAGIWVMAAIGMAMGNGMYVIGGVATGLVLIIQCLLKHPKFKSFTVKVPGHLTVTMDDKMKSLDKLEKVLEAYKIIISTTHIKRHKDNTLTYDFQIQMPEYEAWKKWLKGHAEDLYL